MTFKPRPAQKKILAYRRGKMGISAVPGSGKTETLSQLAAQLICEEGLLGEDQEVLVVTLVNSAVNNFAGRVSGILDARGLVPYLGYRVRTLHGLSHDIVRERPDLVDLADSFEIVDERMAARMLEDSAQTWVRSNPYALEDFISPDVEQRKYDYINGKHWPQLVTNIAGSFIKKAKDAQLTWDMLADRLASAGDLLPLAEMCIAIYHDYQRALNYRGAVDFDDLIRLARLALARDPGYLLRLRQRWPYILEDEAQDSSQLQEEILRLLCGEGGNWVRVGDPNQAIYETFTTANPQYLRDFLAEPDVVAVELPDSGRSTASIIRLANHLIDWVRGSHPVAETRRALAPPHVRPTPEGDPQPNPPDDPSGIYVFSREFSPGDELQAVVDSLARWLPDHPEATVAVLVPRNQRGYDLGERLKARKIEYIEFLQSTNSTRLTAGALSNLLHALAEPDDIGKLVMAYRVWRRADREEDESRERIEQVVRLLRKCQRTEQLLWPRAGQDWLAELELDEDDEYIREQLALFRDLMRRWQAATVLPIDQLLLTLAQDLFHEPAELALSHKLALVLKRAADTYSNWRLPELAGELTAIAKNERRFIGLSEDDTGFDPENYRGKVVITTMHKAKGLEWDRVYMLSVNNYGFPSAMEHDSFIAERWFVRDSLNLEAEALAQLAALRFPETYGWKEGEATLQARIDYATERLRLLYVGITRARRELILTWNNGRNGNLQPAVPFIALQIFQERAQHAAAE